jgi:hypothetical protein
MTKDKSLFHWIVVFCKAYVISTLALFPFLFFFGYFRLPLRVTNDITPIFTLIVIGSVVCFFVFILNLYWAIRTQRKGAIGHSIFLIILSLVSIFLILPATAVVVTKS